MRDILPIFIGEHLTIKKIIHIETDQNAVNQLIFPYRIQNLLTSHITIFLNRTTDSIKKHDSNHSR